MLNGLYTATSGMLQQERRLDVISNNLANINTVGFKKETPTFETYLREGKKFPETIIRESLYNKTINSAVSLAHIGVDFSSGNLKETGKTFDLALSNPNAFFAIDTPFGVKFTRAGNFMLDENRALVTQEGFKVISTNVQNNDGIIIPNGKVSINEDGQIYVDNLLVDAISIVEFENLENLQKTGYNLFTALNTLPIDADNPGVMQGYLEMSNINPLTEMVNMISSQRAFETYQKVIRTIDTLNDRAANELGKIA